MTYPSHMDEVDKILLDWYRGELGGRELFLTLSSAARVGDAEKWKTLAEVETFVSHQLRSVLITRGLDTIAPSDLQARAQVRCAAIAGSSWLETMEWLRLLAVRALERMQDEATQLPPELAAAGDMMVEHERALLSFAEMELGGTPGQSLSHVRRFLAETSHSD